MKTPGERLAFARERAGFSSAREAALALGVSVSTYNAHERSGQPGARGFRIDSAKVYARRFGVSVSWLLAGEGKMERNGSEITADPTLSFVPVRGVAQVGTWNEYEEFDFSEMAPVAVVRGEYQPKDQFAWAIRGDSLNRIGVNEGDFVICVPYWIARTGPTDGDLVAVERRSGPKIERTVKRLRLIGGHYELHPESTNPIHKVIHVTRNTGLHDGDGAEVEIVGLAIAKQGKLL